MPFPQYPDSIAASILVDGELHIADIDMGKDSQVQYFGIQLFKHGSNTDVNMKIKVYTTDDIFITESERLLVKDIPTDTDDYYGWFYFRFKPRLTVEDTKSLRYKLALGNYTYSEASWIAGIYDWPIQMGYEDNPDQIQDSPFAIDVLGAN